MTLGELQEALEQMSEDILITADWSMDNVLTPDHPVVQALGELLADITELEYEEAE